MRIPLMRHIAWYLALAMFLAGVAPRADAGFIPSELIPTQAVDRSMDIEKIQKTLETELIRERLENLGFTHDEIQMRLSRLNDQQIHWLALNLDELKVGGDAVGGIIAVLFIAILAVLLLQITGNRVVVTK